MRISAGVQTCALPIYDEMVRDGANLLAADKTKLVAMNSKLEGLFSAFSSKLLGDEKLYSVVTDKAELAGHEPGFVAPLAAAAEARSGERREGAESVGTCSSRGWTSH